MEQILNQRSKEATDLLSGTFSDLLCGKLRGEEMKLKECYSERPWSSYPLCRRDVVGWLDAAYEPPIVTILIERLGGDID